MTMIRLGTLGRVTLAAAVLLVVPGFAFAQQVGVKAGVNFASLTAGEDEDPDISRRRGLVGGVWVHLATDKRISFQVEGLFSEKGVVFEGGALGVDDTINLRIRYVEVPLLARADLGAMGAPARVFLVGGAAPAFRLSARSRAKVEGEEVTNDNKDDIKPMDLGLVGGLGVQFGRAVVEARYTHGLLHINEDDNGDEDRIKNRVFSVTVGFRFR